MTCLLELTALLCEENSFLRNMKQHKTADITLSMTQMLSMSNPNDECSGTAVVAAAITSCSSSGVKDGVGRWVAAVLTRPRMSGTSLVAAGIVTGDLGVGDHENRD
jgi:hypothetical protein